MTLIINEKSTKTDLAPSGLQPAVCVDCRDLGTVETKFGDKQMILLVFEMAATNDQDDRYLLQKRYTKSLHEKSNLRKDLERWRGQPFKQEQLARGFNLENVVGVPAMIYVEHRETDRGTWAHVESLLPAPDLQLEPSGRYERSRESLQES
ncbi:phage replication initiation protein, NGO0469 family [Rhodohalobacter sp. 8-1]|uniref:phage replication initiation protein, NGO0469 family n=1 Tax=Rhodohalobacter sp. 8-1 TaxID=3131972 RepID=UPI0030EF2779